MLNINQIPESIIDVKATFSKSSSLFRYGGTKYSSESPAKAYKLLIPLKNVVTIPFPKRGNILMKSKLLIFAKNINIILKSIIGINIILLLIIAPKPSLLQIMIPVIKNIITNTIGVLLKYIIFRLSQKLLKKMLAEKENIVKIKFQ